MKKKFNYLISYNDYSNNYFMFVKFYWDKYSIYYHTFDFLSESKNILIKFDKNKNKIEGDKIFKKSVDKLIKFLISNKRKLNPDIGNFLIETFLLLKKSKLNISGDVIDIYIYKKIGLKNKSKYVFVYFKKKTMVTYSMLSILRKFNTTDDRKNYLNNYSQNNIKEIFNV